MTHLSGVERMKHIFDLSKQFEWIPAQKHSSFEKLVSLLDSQTGRVRMESGREGILKYKETQNPELPFLLTITVMDSENSVLIPNLDAYSGEIAEIERIFAYNGKDWNITTLQKEIESWKGCEVEMSPESSMVSLIIRVRVRDAQQIDDLRKTEFLDCMQYFPSLEDLNEEEDGGFEEEADVVCETVYPYQNNMTTACDLRLFM